MVALAAVVDRGVSVVGLPSLLNYSDRGGAVLGRDIMQTQDRKFNHFIFVPLCTYESLYNTYDSEAI